SGARPLDPRRLPFGCPRGRGPREERRAAWASRSRRRRRSGWRGSSVRRIHRFPRDAHEPIPPEWLGTYFRWWGVYPQGDGIGAVGGKGGEGKAVPYFMVRIRIPNGFLLSHQLRTIADVTAKYARGIGDISVRQNIQLHWVDIEDLETMHT